jgi:hypothetical protein
VSEVMAVLELLPILVVGLLLGLWFASIGK